MELARVALVEARHWLRSVGEPRPGSAANVELLLESPVQTWFLTGAELCVTNAGSEASGLWEEALHQDGGASVLHMGVTLFGRRRVRFVQGEGW